MSGLYKTDGERVADIITSNTTKLFSVKPNQEGENVLVPASRYERQLHEEDRASATSRMAIDRAMTHTE
jgi:hypothetical protein